MMYQTVCAQLNGICRIRICLEFWTVFIQGPYTLVVFNEMVLL